MATETHRTKIAVQPFESVSKRLLDTISALYDVDFVPYNAGQTYSGVVCIGGATDAPFPSITFARSSPPLTTVSVDFGNPAGAPEFSHRSYRLSAALSDLPAKASQQTFATSSGKPVWTATADEQQHFVAAALPELKNGDFLAAAFQPFPFALIPLFSFVRSLSPWKQWTRPAFRANIMFDDPNLHALSYGFIDYRELVRHAETHNYHASFATIPLDTWFTNRGSASFLKGNSKRLSLLIHGNNHVHKELARPTSRTDRTALLAQALNRIDVLKQKHGVHVDRVMAAPHGACKEETMELMLALGYEAACISRGSIMAHNKERNWPLTVGLTPTEFMSDGFPVIPRFGFNDIQLRTSFAAFFDQPLIPVGHHDDLKNGIEVMAELARVINAFGSVSWLSLEQISRLQYYSQISGNTLKIRALSRRLTIDIPAGIRRLIVTKGWQADGETLLTRQHAQAPWKSAQDLELTVQTGPIELLCQPKIQIDPLKVPSAALKTWPLIRRVLSEVRDRALPLVHRPKKNGGRRAEPLAVGALEKSSY